MPRAKSSTTEAKRHRKVLKKAKGYRGSRHTLFKTALEAVHHAGVYAYRDRRGKKRDMRRLWIMRINAGARECGLNYSQLIFGLIKADIAVNRKMLSDMAIFDKEAFSALAVKAKQAVAQV